MTESLCPFDHANCIARDCECTCHDDAGYDIWRTVRHLAQAIEAVAAVRVYLDRLGPQTRQAMRIQTLVTSLELAVGELRTALDK